MKQFDYKKFLKENKSTFHASLNEDASGIARKFAQYMSKKEGKKFTVTPGSVDEKSFDLDFEGEEYMGGSYLVKDNGDIVNVAAGNKVYGNVNQLKENKSSLTEGQFSWMTQDTGQQIGSQDENKIPVYMFDNKGKYWFEREYEGYGVFGGKDYYELLDQMNGGIGDRSEGIRKAFDKSKEGETLFPALVVGPSNFNYKTHDFTKEAEHDPNQSWYDASYEEEDEDEDYGGFGDMDREEDYDEEELDEGKAAYEYEKGKAAGEAIEKKKMKVSELKSKIKEMVLSEMDGPAVEDEQYDFLKEIEEMLDEAEGDEDEEVDAEAIDDVTADEDTGAEEIDTTVDVTTNEVDPNVKAVQDALTQAQAAAQTLGDPKLTDQIGNTITFFTRSHVVEKPKGAMAEGEEMEEGYFGANNEVEELIDTLGYETMDEFFSDNPGVITAILDWASSVPEFRTKMIANGLLEAKKENMNESMFPILKRILK